MSIETTTRSQLCELSQLLASRGMASIAAGAISSRLDSKRFVATPPGVSLSLLRPEQLQVHDLTAPDTKATELHRVIYQTRPDIKAVIWARPIATTALVMAGISPAQCLLPFAVGSMEGEAEPTLFSSQRLIEVVRRFDVITLERFGVLSLGGGAAEAFARVEALEQCSQITQSTRSFGVAQLPKAQLDHKIALGNRLQLNQPRECTGCGGCGRSASAHENEAALAAKVAAVFAQKPKSDEPAPFVLPPGRRATCGEAWWLEPETK